MVSTRPSLRDKPGQGALIRSELTSLAAEFRVRGVTREQPLTRSCRLGCARGARGYLQVQGPRIRRPVPRRAARKLGWQPHADLRRQ
jgi:hypothetical protein